MRFIIYLMALCAAFNAHATEYIDGYATEELPIIAKIVNLTTMPVQEALRFCEDHGMDCPAIKEKAIQEGYIGQGEAVLGDEWVSTITGQMVLE